MWFEKLRSANRKGAIPKRQSNSYWPRHICVVCVFVLAKYIRGESISLVHCHVNYCVTEPILCQMNRAVQCGKRWMRYAFRRMDMEWPIKILFTNNLCLFTLSNAAISHAIFNLRKWQVCCWFDASFRCRSSTNNEISVMIIFTMHVLHISQNGTAEEDERNRAQYNLLILFKSKTMLLSTQSFTEKKKKR